MSRSASCWTSSSGNERPGAQGSPPRERQNRSDRFHHRAGRHSVGSARGEVARLPPQAVRDGGAARPRLRARAPPRQPDRSRTGVDVRRPCDESSHQRFLGRPPHGLVVASTTRAAAQGAPRSTRVLIVYTWAPESPMAWRFIERFRATVRSELPLPVEFYESTWTSIASDAGTGRCSVATCGRSTRTSPSTSSCPSDRSPSVHDAGTSWPLSERHGRLRDVPQARRARDRSAAQRDRPIHAGLGRRDRPDGASAPARRRAGRRRRRGRPCRFRRH